MIELNYDESAEVIGCSPRTVRRKLKKYGVNPIRRGHRTVSIPAEKVIRVKIKMILEKRGRQTVVFTN